MTDIVLYSRQLLVPVMSEYYLRLSTVLGTDCRCKIKITVFLSWIPVSQKWPYEDQI